MISTISYYPAGSSLSKVAHRRQYVEDVNTAETMVCLDELRYFRSLAPFRHRVSKVAMAVER